jgi:flagellar export protein FliJ
MKFKFRLETLRKHRKNLEEMARRNFAEAKDVSDGILKQIDVFYDDSDKAREYAGEVIDQGDVDPGLLQLSSEFIDRNKVRIELKKAEFREAVSITEEKQQLLVTAAKETKVLDKLKEKKKEAFIKEIKKRDRKDTDEVVVQRHGHRRKYEE